MQAFALVSDIYMGTSNSNASFRDVIGGSLASAQSNGEIFDYGALDALSLGLGKQNVRPYWAVTYNPWPFQPLTSAANSTGQTFCLGFENDGYPDHYSCVPYGATAFDDCWKCPPKVCLPVIPAFCCQILPFTDSDDTSKELSRQLSACVRCTARLLSSC